jgi:WD40 repeat protein
VAISPDGRLLASGSSDQTIKLWSLPNGMLLKTLQSGAVYSLAINPDGRLLASAGSVEGGAGPISLWSLPDGEPLPVCLMDPAASYCDVKALTYSIAGGSYTVPFGSPIPTGATCTCNSVSPSCGGGCPSVYYYPN